MRTVASVPVLMASRMMATALGSVSGPCKHPCGFSRGAVIIILACAETKRPGINVRPLRARLRRQRKAPTFQAPTRSDLPCGSLQHA